MADNTEFVMKQGATGTVLFFVLEDEVSTVDLTGYEFVKMTLRRPNVPPAINDADCTIDPDQTGNPGGGSFAFDSTTSNIPDGTYNLEFHARDADGRDTFFPTNKTMPYGTVVVEPHLPRL